MQSQNLSLEVDFLRSDLPNQSDNVFGALANNEQLAFQPETTGVVMQVESLIARNIASRRDITVLQEAQTAPPSPNVTDVADNERSLGYEETPILINGVLIAVPCLRIIDKKSLTTITILGKT